MRPAPRLNPPARAFGLSETEAPPTQTMSEGPLVEGIPALGPGDSRVITWGQLGGLRKAIGHDVVVVDYSYRHGRRTLRGQGKLDCRSFKAPDASRPPELQQIDQLKRLADAAEALLHDKRERRLPSEKYLARDGKERTREPTRPGRRVQADVLTKLQG